MGEVYIARRDGSLPTQRVALKLLLPHLADQAFYVEMFLDEARNTSRMNHPNIVQIVEVGEADGRYFMAMQLVEGASLGTLLRACRQKSLLLPLPIVRLIARGLCDALQYAHTQVDHDGTPLNIVHRDVSPHNVLISSAGGVLLTDFGIAKAADNLHDTQPGNVRGKYAYMAPEQLGSRVRVDGRADVFAAAATLFEVYTLIAPFGRSSDPETIDALRQAPLPDFSLHRPDAGPWVAEALARGMARDPAERLPSALALREALMDGEVAELEQLGQWIREHCAEQLTVFQQVAATVSQRSLNVRLPVEAEAPSPRQRPPAWRPAALAAAVTFLAGLGTVGAWKLMTGGSAPAWDPGTEAVRAPALVQPSAPPPSQPVAAAPAPEDDPLHTTPLEPLAIEATPPVAAEPAPSREPRPSARGQKAGRVGYLTADASPWAQVWVDGREVERTPISRYPLPAGEHQLRFHNPELGKDIRRKVRVEPGKVVRLRVDF
jgi:serine/threonine-protein kinase